jgi:hypothetical protein
MILRLLTMVVTFIVGVSVQSLLFPGRTMPCREQTKLTLLSPPLVARPVHPRIRSFYMGKPMALGRNSKEYRSLVVFYEDGQWTRTETTFYLDHGRIGIVHGQVCGVQLGRWQELADGNLQVTGTGTKHSLSPPTRWMIMSYPVEEVWRRVPGTTGFRARVLDYDESYQRFSPEQMVDVNEVAYFGLDLEGSTIID